MRKKPFTGGACIKDTVEIGNKKIDFAYGATVLGMMPDFIFEETGLSKIVQGYYPKNPKLVYFNGKRKFLLKFIKITLNWKKNLEKNGETGKVNEFRNDENK